MATLTEIYEQKLAAGAIRPDDGQRHAVERLEELRKALVSPQEPKGWFIFKKAPPAPKGFYFYGGVGRGKSMVMDMFFDAVAIEKKRRVHFHAFMLEVHDFLHERRTGRAKNARIDSDLIAAAEKISREARLLCFDEFQVKDVADAMILGRLFTALFRLGVTCVMTSNIAPDDLYADGLQRDRFIPFIKLLKEKLDIVPFPGETDYRMQRLRGMQVYFWPHDSDAKSELDRIFRTVADEAEGEKMTITVKGRNIVIPRAGPSVAAFTFSELCEEPKSALDYLELVKRFGVFIVENVPKLDDTRRDAVTRFITLVDTLYDHRARIAVSAAAPPEKLYTGEDNAKVFERTVSRLVEMQSRDYRDV